MRKWHGNARYLGGRYNNRVNTKLLCVSVTIKTECPLSCYRHYLQKCINFKSSLFSHSVLWCHVFMLCNPMGVHASVSQIAELIVSRSANVVNVCVWVCVCVSHSHAKHLTTSEEAWPVLCMLQHVALHVSRRTTSQNPYHTHRPTNTHRKTCMQLHTPKDTGTLAQGTQGMGIHVGWLWGPDVFMSGRVRLGFTVSKSHRVHTHTHTHKLGIWLRKHKQHIAPLCVEWRQCCHIVSALFCSGGCSTAIRLRSADSQPCIAGT